MELSTIKSIQTTFTYPYENYFTFASMIINYHNSEEKVAHRVNKFSVIFFLR